MNDYWLVVVDDDVLCLKSMRSMFADEDIRVSAVRSGRDLLTFMKKSTPDIILLDVWMPEMDGFETIKTLREFEEKEGRRHTPVIFLTGENDTGTENKALDMGASDFIRKPIEKNILLKRIENIISNSKTIENLTEEATTDFLTGFLNKSGAADKMTELCREGKGLLLIFDLDNFKLINDLYGHETGDNVLKGFAEIAKKNTRENDVLCRIGGDEFLAFLRAPAKEQIAASLSERLNKQITEECRRIIGDDFNVPIGVSVGCVPVPSHGGDYRDLFDIADKALYQVKQAGKHGYAYIDPDADEADVEEEDLDKELDRMLTICSERSDLPNAMLVGQDAFIWIYRFIIRFIKRHKSALAILLLSLVSEEGDKEARSKAEEHFGNVLRQKIRKGDVIMYGGANRFFMLLPELTDENIPAVIGRITEAWEDTAYSDDFKIDYRINITDHREELEA